MRKFALAVALLSSGLVSLVVLAFTTPLLAVMRADNRARRQREQLETLGDLGYDDNDPGVDVDRFETSCVRDGRHPDLGPCLACDECRYYAPGSCS